MIKRLLQLITDRLRQWQSANHRHRHSSAPSSPTSAASTSTAPASTPLGAPEHITYTRSRSEAVTTLNRTLRDGKIQRSARAATQSLSPSPHPEINELENTPTENVPELIESLADSAYLCECQGRLNKAEQLYQQALALGIRHFGDRHWAIAPHLSNLAKFYYQQQRYAQAQPRLEQTLELQRQYPNNQHLDEGEALHQLANVYRYLEKYAKAEGLYQQALAAYRKAFGPDHAKTEAVYSDLMQMLTTVIASGQFETLLAELPPLDLDTLGDTYSWAKPSWLTHSEPIESYDWVKLQMPTKDS